MSLWKLMQKLKCLHRLTVLLIYLFIGAAIFEKIERTDDELKKVVGKRILKALQEKLDISDSNLWDGIVNNITQASLLISTPDWTYWRAFDFVFIALSTIGYGDMTPRTTLGQGVFIIYALIGLPIVMLTIDTTGKLLSEVNLRIIVAFEERLLKKKEHKNLLFKCYGLAILLFIGLHLAIGYTYAHFHQATYIEGLYVTFVTLTTIGFGDYRFDILKPIKEDHYSSFLTITEVPLVLYSLTIVSCILNTSVEIAGKLQNKIKTTSVCNDLVHNQDNKCTAKAGQDTTRYDVTVQNLDCNT